jgi:hydroxymethylpyrimidine/phosphomethylpyrimidine kinase
VAHILVIGGTDSSCGAGAYADIETINGLGGTCSLCVTAVTVQGGPSHFKSHSVPPSIVQGQLESIEDQEFDGIKIGMLPDRETIEIVAKFLKRFSKPFVILDPVLKSSSGETLCAEDSKAFLKEKLFPLATLITPNLLEANSLTGETCYNFEGITKLAEKCLTFGSDAVLVKGGHFADVKCKDFLMFQNGENKSFVHERILNGTEVRGTGCRLASAIAYYFTINKSLSISIEKSVDYLRNYISLKTKSLGI